MFLPAMSAYQFRQALKRHAMTQTFAAEKLRVNYQTVRAWVNGRNGVPGPVRAWFELAEEMGWVAPVEERRIAGEQRGRK